ncbi:MAG: transposase [Parasporobacterium sp.]|nr:transposase [Parasporobacterium sp.]
MCYAASKLWNVCNYERIHYKESGMEKYPDWYYQKSHYKDNVWFKSLPSQTAQEVCKLLDKSWKSFYALKKTGGIENPRPPRFKQSKIAVTYMQNGIRHESGSEQVRLSIPRKLKEYMKEAYQISDNYLFLKNRIFKDTDRIKQLKLYPPKDGRCELIAVYEIEDPKMYSDNGHYLSVDLGLHNLMTCYDSCGKSFIMGRNYLSICRKYDKEIARVQSQWASQQSKKGIRYPKPSTHVLDLYGKKRNSVRDYLHKITRSLTDYCAENDIRTVIIGDIRNIRKGTDLGKKNNQKLHSLPYEKICAMLEYKLKLKGIRLVKQEESYTSQCSPYAAEVSRECAQKGNRKTRGLYVVKDEVFNADAVGAYNIMRKYFAVSGIHKDVSVSGLRKTEIIKVAV